MTEAVVLAAGLSSRTSHYKMTLYLGRKTVLAHTVDTMLRVCERVIVVAGHKAEACKKALAGRTNVKVVFNPGFESGMFSSVQRGVQELKSNTFFIIPGDQPVVSEHTLRKMLDADGAIINPAYKGKKGHPVLFRGQCREGILAMPADGILRDFIHAHPSRTVSVDDEGILLDIDEDKDYEAIKRKFFETGSHGKNN